MIRTLYGKELWKNHGQTQCFWEYPFNLLFVLRNYKECITSFTGPGWAAASDFDRNASFNENDVFSMTGHAKALPNYLRLLKHYDELEKDKMLVYYEDFVLDPVATLEEVVKFLTNFGWSVSEEAKQEFYKNIEKHRKISYGNAESSAPFAEHKSNGKDLIFHSDNLPIEQRINTDNYIKKYHSHLWEKYLKRYEETYDSK